MNTLKLPKPILNQINQTIKNYPQKRSAALMLCHTLQDHLGHLPPAAEQWIAHKLDLQPIHIHELITFYPMLHQNPIGKHHLKICRTLPCALAGAQQLHQHLCKKLNLNPNNQHPQTTPDQQYTLETVECLAHCHTPPILTHNNTLHQHLTPQKANTLLTQTQKKQPTKKTKKPTNQKQPTPQ